MRPRPQRLRRLVCGRSLTSRKVTLFILGLRPGGAAPNLKRALIGRSETFRTPDGEAVAKLGRKTEGFWTPYVAAQVFYRSQGEVSTMPTRFIQTTFFLIIAFAINVLAQTPERAPSKPMRPFVVLPAQSLSDLEKKLQTENKAQDVIGGVGMQLRVAVQHDLSRPTAAAEVHDASDDVYYVLAGAATLVVGGSLDAPKEIEPGEWRSPKINDGQTFQLNKGDLIVVPRGTPHQRTGKDFSMILIKIFAAPLPAPK